MARLEELARQILELTDRHDWVAREAMLAPDCEFVTPAGAQRGPAATTAFSAPYAEAFPAARHQVDLVVGAGDAAVAEGLWIATHRGPLVTPQGPIPATGRTVTVPFVMTMRVSGELIASVHVYFDQMSLLGQLGLLPEPQPV